MKITSLILAVIFIIFGYFMGYLIPFSQFSNTEIPYISLLNNNFERLSPQDYIKEDQIIVTENQVIINIKDAFWSRYADTNSMDPVFDEGHNGIEIVPDCNRLQPGDIVAYQSDLQNNLIVHRIININSDSNGLLFTLKGDNSPLEDPQKIECDQIKYQLIGVLY